MDVFSYAAGTADDNPLARMVFDGGYCGIFRTIGCIGDSLSSGEFESMSNGEKGYHDMFDYSWGQYIARHCGCRVYNFSRGGMSASEYWNSFAEQNGFWDEDKLCQAYIMALGVNDIIWMKQELGSVRDICLQDLSRNADTFAGYYARIIQRLRGMQPKARFFLMTMPRENDGRDHLRAAHAALLHDIADAFEFAYVIDLFKYAPVYDDEFKRKYYLGGHLNPQGYIFTARMVESYIDHIIRARPEDFAQVGFIGTPYHNESGKW